MTMDKIAYNGEPSIRELLADPVVQAMMTRDGVTSEAMKALIARAQSSLDVGASSSHSQT